MRVDAFCRHSLFEEEAFVSVNDGDGVFCVALFGHLEVLGLHNLLATALHKVRHLSATSCLD